MRIGPLFRALDKTPFCPSPAARHSYITLEVAETEDGESVFRVVYNAKEMTLPGATSVWVPLPELQQR